MLRSHPLLHTHGVRGYRRLFRRSGVLRLRESGFEEMSGVSASNLIGGTSLVTTEPAPMMAPLPMWTPFMIRDREPI